MHHDWSCSVQPVVGRETPMDLESYQVTEASSDDLHEIYDGLSALPTKILSDMIMPSTRRNIEDDEIILIPETCCGKVCTIYIRREAICFCSNYISTRG